MSRSCNKARHDAKYVSISVFDLEPFKLRCIPGIIFRFWLHEELDTAQSLCVFAGGDVLELHEEAAAVLTRADDNQLWVRR